MSRVSKIALLVSCIGLIFAGSVSAQGFDSTQCDYVEFVINNDYFGIGGEAAGCDGGASGLDGDSFPPGWCLSLSGPCDAGQVWVDSGVAVIQNDGTLDNTISGNRVRQNGRVSQDTGSVQICNLSDINDCPACSDGSSDTENTCPSGPDQDCFGRGSCFDYVVTLYCCAESGAAQVRAGSTLDNFELSVQPVDGSDAIVLDAGGRNR